jgi:hypothetical protein
VPKFFSSFLFLSIISGRTSTKGRENVILFIIKFVLDSKRYLSINKLGVVFLFSQHPEYFQRLKNFLVE